VSRTPLRPRRDLSLIFTRFRRSFIGHYAAGSLEKISKFYLPLVKMDGTDYEVAAQAGGGACGQDWVGAVH
jgi:phytanoyl-CoA hydroxylase